MSTPLIDINILKQNVEFWKFSKNFDNYTYRVIIISNLDILGDQIMETYLHFEVSKSQLQTWLHR